MDCILFAKMVMILRHPRNGLFFVLLLVSASCSGAGGNSEDDVLWLGPTVSDYFSGGRTLRVSPVSQGIDLDFWFGIMGNSQNPLELGAETVERLTQLSLEEVQAVLVQISRDNDLLNGSKDKGNRHMESEGELTISRPWVSENGSRVIIAVTVNWDDGGGSGVIMLLEHHCDGWSVVGAEGLGIYD